jgi:hypothetical protein
MQKYFYKLLWKYISLYCLENNTIAEIFPRNKMFEVIGVKNLLHIQSLEQMKNQKVNYFLLNGSLHYERDIQATLSQIQKDMIPSSRLILIYYSSLWKPIITLATWLGLRTKEPEQNWLSHEDIENFLLLSDLELVRREQKVLLPVYIPIFSNLLNRYIAPLPFFRNFCLVNLAVAKPISQPMQKASVSIVVPARNEEGNIENIVKRIPKMGEEDELIFVEGNSTDNTWKKIQEVAKEYKGHLKIKITQQEGKGKGDAVRKGFGMAEKEILMILDADLTVPPEDLPKFYRAIVEGKGEFINGSRLVYPMEKKAMRFFNMIGNKFFALAFSFVLGQRFKDTLCGTKVLTRENYLKLAVNRTYFGEFDPFGDFDLIFGASRMCLKIVEVPITYRERTYGDTNISRWKHGTILLAMLVFAARRIKFI